MSAGLVIELLAVLGAAAGAGVITKQRRHQRPEQPPYAPRHRMPR